jgi:AraC-like DNA-binding protein
MDNLLNTLTPEAITITLLQPGSFDIEVVRSNHTKVAPCTIIAQAYEGRYGIRCGDKGGVTKTEGVFISSSGDFLNIDHIGDPQTGRMKARWLHVSYKLWDTIDIMSLLTIPLIVPPSSGRDFGQVIQVLLDIEQCNNLEAVAKRQMLAWQMLAMISTISPLRQDAEQQLSIFTRLHPVLLFMHQHLAEQISITDMSAVAGISPSRLYAIFQRWFHTSPMEYMKSLRIHQTAHLLLSTDESLAEIAERVGFTNPFHLSREFKRLLGVPPSDYRRFHLNRPV